MIFTLVYNEFIKTIDIDINKKIGIIQEELLNKCALMIYNIEYTEILIKNIDNKSYILGSDEVDFNITFKEFLDNIEKTENDIDKIIIYDRKRDSNGNVCKNNIIIDRYTSWFQNYENDNFDASYLNESYLDYTPTNSHIIRFPLESLLTNILNINNNTNNNNTNNTNTQNQNTEESQTTQDNNHEVSNDIPNLTIDPDLVNSSNEYFNNFNIRLNEMMNRYNNSHVNNNNNQNLHNPLSSINRQFMTRAINIFDNLIRNMNEIPINEMDSDETPINETDLSETPINEMDLDETPINEMDSDETPINEMDSDETTMRGSNPSSLNNNTYETSSTFNIFPISSFLIDTTIMNNNNIYNYNNIFSNNNFDSEVLQEDVKIILTEEEFDKIDSEEYKEENNPLECLICTEYFEENDIFKKLKCNHVFHTECIKPWLCEESHKCPICRLDAGKGTIKNLIKNIST